MTDDTVSSRNRPRRSAGSHPAARRSVDDLRGSPEPHAQRAERLIRVLWPERYPDLAALEETMNRHAASTGMFLLDAGMSGGGSGKRIGSERLRGLNSPPLAAGRRAHS
ncbi:MAG: hypothetical protein ACLSHC_10480 [Bilophila wadsworthia]